MGGFDLAAVVGLAVALLIGVALGLGIAAVI